MEEPRPDANARATATRKRGRRTILRGCHFSSFLLPFLSAVWYWRVCELTCAMEEQLGRPKRGRRREERLRSDAQQQASHSSFEGEESPPSELENGSERISSSLPGSAWACLSLCSHWLWLRGLGLGLGLGFRVRVRVWGWGWSRTDREDCRVLQGLKP
jgi:hypothetical protein